MRRRRWKNLLSYSLNFILASLFAFSNAQTYFNSLAIINPTDILTVYEVYFIIEFSHLKIKMPGKMIKIILSQIKCLVKAFCSLFKNKKENFIHIGEHKKQRAHFLKILWKYPTTQYFEYFQCSPRVKII